MESGELIDNCNKVSLDDVHIRDSETESTVCRIECTMVMWLQSCSRAPAALEPQKAMPPCRPPSYYSKASLGSQWKQANALSSFLFSLASKRMFFSSPFPLISLILSPSLPISQHVQIVLCKNSLQQHLRTVTDRHITSRFTCEDRCGGQIEMGGAARCQFYLSRLTTSPLLTLTFDI